MFASPEAVAALERTVAAHFLRTGQFETAETFIEVRPCDRVCAVAASRR